MIATNSLDAYFSRYGKLLQQNAQQAMRPLHTPGRDAPVFVDTLRKPFPRQHDAISGGVKAMRHSSSILVNGTMGTGKTLMGQLIVHAHAGGKPYRAIVFCPGQLVLKWERELRETIPGVVVHQLSDWRDVVALERSDPTAPTWYVISRDRAKLGACWQPAVIERHGKAHCPKCGAVQMKDDVPQEIAYFAKEKRECECGEQLWQHNRKIDRWEPAWYIKRKLKGFFRYLILDEVHEEKSAASAQANAAGALISACRYTIALTGTLIGGYAEHLRPLLFRLAPSSIVGEGFTWENSLPFSEKYGRIEKRVTTSSKDCDDGDSNVMSRGRTNRSVMRCVRPGIVPTLLKHIVGNTVFLGLEDVAENLPDLEEELIPVPMDPMMESDYSRMEKALTAVMKDRFHPGQKKILGPALNAMINWTDHPHDWDEIGYKDEKGFFHGIVQPTNYPKSLRAFPKEEKLIDLVKAERALGRQVWVYVQLTDKHDVAGRLQTLLQAEGMRVEVMRSTVEPAKREAWITKHCRGADVCISHPKLVETGLDLFDKGGNHNMSTLVFYETGYNLFTMRQAARRSWRIGQHMLCKVFYMYYEDTMQERAMALMGRKLSAAEALEGKFSSDGLAAMVGEDESLELALAKSLAEQAEIEAASEAWNRPVMAPKPVTQLINKVTPKPATQPVAKPVAVPVVSAATGRNMLIEALKKLQAKQLGKVG